jgi:hypothetical protein
LILYTVPRHKDQASRMISKVDLGPLYRWSIREVIDSAPRFDVKD